MTFGATTDPVVEPAVEEEVASPVTTELPDEIQKKITHQDAHIAKLEQEAAERDAKLIAILESQVDKANEAKGNEELVRMIEELKTPAPTQETPQHQEISIDEIVGAVGNQLKEQALEAKREENLNASVTAAKEYYGEDKFDEEIVQLAASKSMSIEEVNTMARNNPKVFAELFMPDRGTKSSAPDIGSSVLGGGQDPAALPKPKSISKMNTKERIKYVQQLMAAQQTN